MKRQNEHFFKKIIKAKIENMNRTKSIKEIAS